MHLKSKEGKDFVDHLQTSFGIFSCLEEEGVVVDVENLVYYEVDASLHVLSGVAGELSFRHLCDVFEFRLGDVV